MGPRCEDYDNAKRWLPLGRRKRLLVRRRRDSRG